ncbi:serine/threonine-protein kinase [Kineococcus sp. NUM-3379]
MAAGARDEGAERRGAGGQAPPRVDGYAVGGLLGRGGSASVWQGTGPDGVPCALKVLEHPPGGSGGALLRELSLLRRVRHPNVVAVRDITTSGDLPVLVLDLAAGGSLADLVRRRRRLLVGEVVTLLTELGPALEDLHAMGVVHADLSPGNVLLAADGTPLLADLGVARALGGARGAEAGTEGFCDPVLLGGAAPTAASDVYGLAAVAWFALTGAAPAPGGLPGRRRAGRSLPEGVPAELAAVLAEALHPRPQKRPAPVELAVCAAEAAPARAIRVPGAGAAGAATPGVGVAGAATPGAGSPVAVAGGAAGAGVEAPGGADAGAAGVVAAGSAVPPAVEDATAVTRRIRALAVAGGDTASPGPAPAAGSRRSGRTPGGSVARAGTADAARRPGRRRAGGDGSRAGRARGVRAAAGRSRRLLPLLGGAAAGVLALVAAVLLLPGGPPGSGQAAPAPQAPAPAPAASAPPSAPAPSAPPSAPAPSAPQAGSDVLAGEDLPAVVEELARRRAGALEAGDPELLRAVDAPASPAMTADAQLIGSRRGEGRTWRGLGFEVRSVQVEEAGQGRTVVLADVVTTAHRSVERDGVVQEVAATQPRRSRLTLVRVDGEWRVSAIG